MWWYGPLRKPLRVSRAEGGRYRQQSTWPQQVLKLDDLFWWRWSFPARWALTRRALTGLTSLLVIMENIDDGRFMIQEITMIVVGFCNGSADLEYIGNKQSCLANRSTGY